MNYSMCFYQVNCCEKRNNHLRNKNKHFISTATATYTSCSRCFCMIRQNLEKQLCKTASPFPYIWMAISTIEISSICASLQSCAPKGYQNALNLPYTYGMTISAMKFFRNLCNHTNLKKFRSKQPFSTATIWRPKYFSHSFIYGEQFQC